MPNSTICLSFDFDAMSSAARFAFLTGAVVPRPIALITTLTPQGGCNAAPYTFFSIAGTEPRERLWRALTPQMFRRAALERALEAAMAAGETVTDESMAMERLGLTPMLVEGAEDNIKVTTPADLALAEFLLARLDG